MKKIIVLLLLLSCAGTEKGAIEKIGNEKNVFFSLSVKEGYNFLKMSGYELKKLDSVNERTGKVYIFYYKQPK